MASVDSPFHRVGPVAKLLVTVGYVVAVASFPAAAVTPLAPLLLYPVLCAAVAGIPARLLLSRVAAVLPFAVLLGAANPLLDRTPALVLGTLVVSRGWMSFLGIVTRTLLVVAATLCLAALSGIEGIARALERLRVPPFLVLQMRLMFRHLATLTDEVRRTLLAYRLRSGRDRSVTPRSWGAVAGGLLLRSIARAERVHLAMSARGGTGPLPRGARARARPADWLFAGGWLGWFALCRFVDLSALVGILAGRSGG